MKTENFLDRRRFLGVVGLGTAAMALDLKAATARHIATNVYPWMTFYRRSNREWNDERSRGIAEIAQTGIQGFEPIAESPEQIDLLEPLLKKYQLEMRSLYVNSSLHEADRASESIAEVHAISIAAKGLGAEIVVTNPSPIRWGSPENKTDAQLEEQARNLERLGSLLRDEGLRLAYHNHDAELRNGAREFHHMMLATSARNVKLCLDAHWIYRGCGNSQVALFDVLEHYGSRIIELHLRQSVGGVWTESFSFDGDIDYRRLFTRVHELQRSPLLVLEQAVEEASPNTRTALKAHKASYHSLREGLS